MVCIFLVCNIHLRNLDGLVHNLVRKDRKDRRVRKVRKDRKDRKGRYLVRKGVDLVCNIHLRNLVRKGVNLVRNLARDHIQLQNQIYDF